MLQHIDIFTALMDVTTTEHYSTSTPPPMEVIATEHYSTWVLPPMDIIATEHYSTQTPWQ